MPRLVMIVAALLVVVLVGGVAWFGFADIAPTPQTVQLEIPNDRLPR